MRQKKTRSETKSINTLISSLATEELYATLIPEITDCPDGAISLNGKTIALECRTFTPEKILKLHGMKIKRDAPYMCCIPIEPHLWIKKAIQDKNDKVETYKSNANADEVWLLLHEEFTPMGHLGLAEHEKEKTTTTLFIGANSIKHKFDRVYMTFENGNVLCIYQKENKEEQYKIYSKKEILCVLIKRYVFMNVVATEAENGEGKITMNFNQDFLEQHFLQPLDTRFKADYSKYENTKNAFLSMKTLPNYFYAEPT